MVYTGFNKDALLLYACVFRSEAGWKPLTDGGEVVQVARNSITFDAPRGLPGKLCFLDPLSSYLEVVSQPSLRKSTA